jgi:hypothetical protein
MGDTRRCVRIGILVVVASTLISGSIISIAAAGTAGSGAVDAAPSVVGETTLPTDGVSPRATPVIGTRPIERQRGVVDVEATEGPVVAAVVDEPVIEVPAAPILETDRVVLVGDSLADEASSVIRYLTPGKLMIPRYFGGTAPCDWLDRELQATPTTVVVITFTGNNHGDCMLDAFDAPMVDDELVEKYTADVRVLIDRATAAGAWVVLVGQPRHHPVLDADVEIEGLNAAYRELADTLPHVSFVDAGHHVETPDGHYTDRLPCTEHDVDCAPDGTTIVRGDGVHFCPVVQVNPCPVWSSGAVRFGAAIATAVNDPTELQRP